jgi:glycogen debranching enzyme
MEAKTAALSTESDSSFDRNAERRRLEEDASRERNWKRWGPYLSERQWATVREDYSANGQCWDYFPHDHARSRAYRWGEDGLLGICDRQCRLVFALALWNGRDPILKERLFGLTGPEGNHGEDVKELYYYLDATPTYSYTKSLYKYPQAAFPYGELVEENRRRGRDEREYELLDTGVFDRNCYFDVFCEYAKAAPDDLCIRITVANRGSEAATLHLLPTLWFRNTWCWGRTGEGHTAKPTVRLAGDGTLLAQHQQLPPMRLAFESSPNTGIPTLFTDNETNRARLFGAANTSQYVKDSFHRFVIEGDATVVNPAHEGTKAAVHYQFEVAAEREIVLRLRLFAEEGTPTERFGAAFDRVFADRIREANAFYESVLPTAMTPEERNVARQGYAAIVHSRQFFHYIVRDWLAGDPAQPAPPPPRHHGRNHDWGHLYNRDILSMPDKWEYPWYAAWDLAFHMIPMARVDPEFAKEQLLLLLREWYMHPNGQIPAYEFEFSDVNPPVHAWAAWRVYKLTGPRSKRDRVFLRRVFDKLVINFTWWVNRKDTEGKHVFGGGFLGLDNIGVFDRSQPLPTGGHLEQADGTAWMAFYAATMLSMAIELAQEDSVYEDVASKFFEHFVAITDAMNTLGGSGLWDEKDGFYYDQLHANGQHIPLRVRSMVGLLPLIAVEVLEEGSIAKLPGFSKRMQWFLRNRRDLSRNISYMASSEHGHKAHRLLAIPSRERLERVLRYLLDEREFLGPYGIRALSRVHLDEPFRFDVNGHEWRVDYVPGEGNTGLFGGNSNWRGPIWFPVNYLLVEALERYHHFYGDSLEVEFPTGSGRKMSLRDAARELANRLGNLFLPDPSGARPCHGNDSRYADDPHFRELLVFPEYYQGDDGRGLGARYQGWSILGVACLEKVARLSRASVARPSSCVASKTTPDTKHFLSVICSATFAT